MNNFGRYAIGFFGGILLAPAAFWSHLDFRPETTAEWQANRMGLEQRFTVIVGCKPGSREWERLAVPMPEGRCIVLQARDKEEAELYWKMVTHATGYLRDLEAGK